MWRDNKYLYSKRTLKTIAENYVSLYEGLPLSLSEEVTNPWSLAEFKADFDMALQNIGRGKWNGNLNGHIFNDYRPYGRLQRIVIADIMGIEDNELEGLGFWGIPRLRGYAYYLMCCFLNNGEVNK